ncbi:MAG: pyrroloquinoline quinone biosynthesis protein PqqF [Pseudomonas sp.]|uniref:pyrroloquinoline quinone biosynthesis protein PqqF n=1 Tax=Pseudomonas sp. TaxID=306 RepID=UPI0033152E87
MSDTNSHVTLANGLQLILRHAPHLKRSAAALRVHAGSHDAAPQWPGLAHFLEHLFFLGTARFPLEDGLMRYVQALGGQVNASTRERTTDFFFEVPPAALAGGLERLCQMLAEPDLGIERQRREREVIHAEFIAWSRNPQAQQQFALLQSVTGNHPLSAFHAGNHYSLPLQSSAFQDALVGFHKRFYHAGQITLSLCGPQPLDELEQLGRRLAGIFKRAVAVPQAMPPALASGEPLLFAHQGLPAGAERALALLMANLSDNRPGSWLGELQRRGWLKECKVEQLYAFAGQLLWHIDLKLNPCADSSEALKLLHGWFGYIRQASPTTLNQAFGLLQQRRQRSAGALALARADSAAQPFAALDSQGLTALAALLEQLPQRATHPWQLPEPDPLLLDEMPAHQAGALPPSLSVSSLLPPTRHHAALFLRWHIASPSRRPLQRGLERALQPLQMRCEQAGVQLQFSGAGDYWQLRCAGHPAAVIRATAQALTSLQAPCDWPSPAPEAPALIPIRALIGQLPDAVLGSRAEPQAHCAADQTQLDDAWQHSRWHGLAVGFDTDALQALGALLQSCPGQGVSPSPAARWAGRRWQRADVPGSENALLLFCPVPDGQQGCGRLLAQSLQGPVYQRLRVELQLGYAVFSTFRQIEGVGGLLFGVQSPHASHAEILVHLHALLRDGVTLDEHARKALAEQFDEPAMANADVAEWAWQARLAAEPDDLRGLKRAILDVRQADLDGLLRQLLAEDHAWLCVANAAAPDSSWK